MTGTVLSKRKLIQLIEGKYVNGWDDPRLFTLVALRRRGVPPGSILSFINEIGVTKANTQIETVRFERSIRAYLETTVPRLMIVLEPIRVIIDNLPDDHLEMLEFPYSKDPAFGVSGFIIRWIQFILISFLDPQDPVHEEHIYRKRRLPGRAIEGFLPVSPWDLSRSYESCLSNNGDIMREGSGYWPRHNCTCPLRYTSRRRKDEET